jgi:hypothetical protein
MLTRATVEQLFSMISTGVIVIGGGIAIFGLVTLGMAWREGFQGGGQQVSTGIGGVVAGVIVAAAGALFKALGTQLASLLTA